MTYFLISHGFAVRKPGPVKLSIKATAMLDNKQKSLLRGLIYPVQFDENPKDGVDRVLNQVIHAKAMNASPVEYLAAVQCALQSDERLSALIPQKHTESTIRTYLAEIQKRFCSG